MFLGAADATAAAATTTAALGLAQEAREVRRRRAEGPVRGYTSNADPQGPRVASLASAHDAAQRRRLTTGHGTAMSR